MRQKVEIKAIEHCLVGTILLYVATYMAVVRNGELGVDFRIHTSWITMLDTGELTIREFLMNKTSYPAWHVLTGVLYKFIGLNENEAAATSTAIFNCFAYWCVNCVWIFYGRIRNTKPKCNVYFWSFLLMVMGPMYVPRYTRFYYLGQGSGNIWHNPTNIAVKGIAILAFMLVAFLVEKVNNSLKLYFVLSILLIISALEKPSFLQGIIPGLGLYMTIRFLLVEGGRREAVAQYKNYIKIILSFVPAVVILILQFYVSFFGGEQSEGIGIAYGYVLHNYSLNLFYSFVLAFAFPIVVLIIDFRDMMKDCFFQLACCYEFSAWAESAFIYEKGARTAHGNWLWASYLSMFIVWMISLIKFCSYISKEADLTYKRVLGIGLGVGFFVLQVLCGFFYWYSIVTGVQMY